MNQSINQSTKKIFKFSDNFTLCGGYFQIYAKQGYYRDLSVIVVHSATSRALSLALLSKTDEGDDGTEGSYLYLLI